MISHSLENSTYHHPNNLFIFLDTKKTITPEGFFILTQKNKILKKGKEKMQYIDKMNAYYKYLLVKPVSPNARSLYCQLFNYNNSLGWIEKFSVANSVMAAKSGLSLQQMQRSRQELVNNGYIRYKKSKHSSQTGEYEMLNLDFGYQKNENFNTQTELKPDSIRTQTESKPNPNRTQTETLIRLDKDIDKTNIKKENVKEKIEVGDKKQKKPTPTKLHYGEFDNVLLTESEYKNLFVDFGDDLAKDYIDRLSGYLASTGKRYKSHYATIQNWARKDGVQRWSKLHNIDKLF